MSLPIRDTGFKKALVRLGAACNNGCLFCHARNLHAAGPDLDTEQARQRIRAVADAGADTVVFSGGEPTIRKDIAGLCRYAASLGIGPGLITNGRLLSYQNFCDELVGAGLNHVLVSLHGADEQTHNALTGTESFAQTLKGIRNVSRAGVPLVINTVITAANAPQLGLLHRIVARFAPVHHKISLPEPKGAILDHPDLALPVNSAARAVNELIAERRGAAPGVTLGADGFTPCLLTDFFHFNDDFFTHGFRLIAEHDGLDLYSPDHGDRAYADACLDCSYYHLCPGIYSRWFENGVTVHPVSAPVSCEVRFNPMAGEPGPGDPARRLAVIHGTGIKWFESGEIFTSPEELTNLKLGLEQVYEVSDGEIEHGFAPRHLNKMALNDMCRTCPALKMCHGVFTAQERQPFGALVDDMRQIMAGVRGRVCEAGPGAVPVCDTDAGLCDPARISFYLGIDPHETPGVRPETEHRRFRSGCFEDFVWDGELFDFVIMFRSYSHLQNLPRALDTLRAILKPGGKAIIAENTRLITLYPGDVRPADSEAHEHPHFRNHSAQAVSRALSLWDFTTEILFDTTSRSANIWCVVAEKARVNGA